VRLGRTALATMLMSNVVELKFQRRIDKPGHNAYRRMLCTNDKTLLLSTPGRNVLNYTPPTGGNLKYNPAAKNLIPVWDIFMQDYRMINCNNVEVIAVIRSTPADDFWKYFFESIAPMSADQKAHFMDV
jgi:hypothetical protein